MGERVGAHSAFRASEDLDLSIRAPYGKNQSCGWQGRQIDCKPEPHSSPLLCGSLASPMDNGYLPLRAIVSISCRLSTGLIGKKFEVDGE